MRALAPDEFVLDFDSPAASFAPIAESTPVSSQVLMLLHSWSLSDVSSLDASSESLSHILLATPSHSRGLPPPPRPSSRALTQSASQPSLGSSGSLNSVLPEFIFKSYALTIDVLYYGHLSISYDSILKLLQHLANHCIQGAHEIVCGPHMLGYNINISTSIFVERRRPESSICWRRLLELGDLHHLQTHWHKRPCGLA